MTNPVEFAQVWRGEMLESVHLGHAVVCNQAGEVVESWGNPDLLMFPRSSCKMVQALPLLESGAGAGLSTEQLALACASHKGGKIHTDRVAAWLGDLGLSEGDMRCGAHEPTDIEARDGLIRAGDAPCQLHNNCSGKHAGFLMLNQHLGGGTEYVDPDHVVQRTVKQAFQEVTGEVSPTYGIDGCSAPNFATSLTGLARAMAFFANAHHLSGARAEAAVKLREAMMLHPELVAGQGRACTELMRAMGGRVAIKTGAEAVFVAILPEQGLGVALKVADGTTRGAECAIAQILIRLGVLQADHPAVSKFWNAPILNCRGMDTGAIRPGAALV